MIEENNNKINYIIHSILLCWNYFYHSVMCVPIIITIVYKGCFPLGHFKKKPVANINFIIAC